MCVPRRSTGSHDVVVCVIDSGIDYTHPDLQGNVWINPGEIPNNGIDDDRNGYVDDYHGFNFLANSGDPMDNNYHGTHLSGMVGALCNNNIGVCGVNQAVKVMGCKFLDGSGNGYTSDAVRRYTSQSLATVRGRMHSEPHLRGGLWQRLLWEGDTSHGSM